ncbi:MAG: family 1 glycosylhydrolase [Candidatus Omnitrophica bacterium]|nr:family 1 glycosylhydrolase [Candidatus Omnitrophota bacterium]
MIQFPHNFLWGAATSAYQVEGNNSNSDWWPWEKLVHLKDHSGNACRHYELFSEDFNLAKSLNHTCHRLSVEWGRIEPEEGKFSSQEIEHYLKVILSLRERNIIPIVTLHHFTNPIWFARLGGWENKKAPQYFSRYAEKIVTALAGKVDFWVTINEPMVYTYYGYLLGLWPPQEKSIFKTKKVVDHLFSAHVKTYRLIHGIYKRLNLAEPKVSIAQNMQAFVSCTPTLRNKIAVYLRDKSYNLDFIEKSIRRRSLDFIGVNYYSRSQVELNGWGVKN